MAKKYMQKHSISSGIKEVQIKTAMKYHPTPVRMTSIQEIKNKFWQGCGGKELSYTTGESN